MSSVRLDPTIQEKLRQVATMTGMTISEVHRHALEQYCNNAIAGSKKSRYSEFIGVGASGRDDLSVRHKEVYQEILDEKYAEPNE